MTTRKNRLPVLILSPVIFAGAAISACAAAISPNTHILDSVIAGDEASESAHQMKGEFLSLQKTNNSSFRAADTNGWVSWTLQVLPDVALDLNVEIGSGSRAAPSISQISVDDQRLATVRVAGAPRSEYYRLTPATTAGKSSITVRFQSASNACGIGIHRITLTRIPPPTIASLSKASSSRTNYAYIVNAINDQREPADSSDHNKKHFD